MVKHPLRDEFLVGGADGIPKIYRVFRETERKIGDDANLIGAFEAMPGRIFGVATSADGRTFAAASSLDRRGQVDIYRDGFDLAASPEAIRATAAKPGKNRSAEERAALDKFRREQIRKVATVAQPGGSLYALAIRPDGSLVATAGTEGTVRLIDPASGAITREFCPVPLAGSSDPALAPVAPIASVAPAAATNASPEPAITGSIQALDVRPSVLDLTNRSARAQLVVTATTATGDPVDVTRAITVTGGSGVVAVGPSGVIQPVGDGSATLSLGFGGQTFALPVQVASMARPARGDYVRDVAPGPVEARLQHRHLPRLGAREERVQALAPGIRPDLRCPSLDRRPRLAPGQPRLARR